MSEQLQKTKGLPVIEVGLDERLLTDEEAIQVLRETTGIATLKPNSIRGMAQLGLYARGVGVLRKQRGEVIVTQSWLNETIQVLIDRFQEEHARGSKARISVLRGLAHDISTLTGTKIDSQRLALELEKVAAPTGKPDDIEKPRNLGFGTGTVIAAQEVHVHEAKKELPPPSGGA